MDLVLFAGFAFVAGLVFMWLLNRTKPKSAPRSEQERPPAPPAPEPRPFDPQAAIEKGLSTERKKINTELAKRHAEEVERAERFAPLEALLRRHVRSLPERNVTVSFSDRGDRADVSMDRLDVWTEPNHRDAFYGREIGKYPSGEVGRLVGTTHRPGEDEICFVVHFEDGARFLVGIEHDEVVCTTPEDACELIFYAVGRRSEQIDRQRETEQQERDRRQPEDEAMLKALLRQHTEAKKHDE